jgi:hypothetical protein
MISPSDYRNALVFPGARGPAKLSSIAAEFQSRDFAALDPALLALASNAGKKPAVGRYWIERTKGASKDTDLAVSLLWLLAFSPRPLVCQVGAADQEQADELRRAAKSILRLNPWLADGLDVQNSTIVNKRTDCRCDFLTSDVASSHGARPDVLVCNELSHVPKEEFVRNLMDNAAKMPHGLVIIATNAGFVPSWQWDLRELARASSRWHFATYADPAPWLDPEEIAEARRRNPPLRFARLFGGQWVRGLGDALSSDDILTAVLPDLGPMNGTEVGWAFFAGLDIGVSRDFSALVVVGRNAEGRSRLASVRWWAPQLRAGGAAKVDLTEVEDAVLAASRRFQIAKCLYDPSQCEHLAQRCQREGVPMDALSFSTPSNRQALASVLLESFHSRVVDLYDDPDLLQDLYAFKLADKGFTYQIEVARSAGGGHGDRGIAFVLALLAARRGAAYVPEGEASPPFVVLPGRGGGTFHGTRAPPRDTAGEMDPLAHLPPCSMVDYFSKRYPR